MTQNTQRTATTRLNYVVDQSSLQAALAANKALLANVQSSQQGAAASAQMANATKVATVAIESQISTLDKLSKAFADVGRQNTFDKLARQAAAGTISVNALATELQSLGATDAQINQVANSIANLQTQAQKSGLESALFNVRQGLIALPGVGFQSPVTVGVRGAELAVSQLGLGVGALGALGLAAAATVVVFNALTAETERVQQATKARLDVEKQVRESVIEATRQEALLQRERASQQLSFEQAELDRLKNVRVDLTPVEAILAATSQTVFYLTQGAGELRAYNEQMSEQELAVVAAQSALDAWNGLIGENATLTSDIVDNANRQLELDRLTSDERQRRMEQDERDVAILSALADQAGVGSAAYNLLHIQIDALIKDITDLSNVSVSYADILAAEEQQRKNAEQTLKDLNEAMQREAEARQDLIDIEQKAIDAQREAASKLQDALDDANEKRANSEADAEERRREIAADGAERRERIEADDAERRAEILKRFNRDYTNAVAERDALAAYKAKQTRDDELDKQDKAHKKQLDELEKQLDKQYKAVQKSLDKQLRTIQDNYDRQVREIQQSLDKQLQALQKEHDRAEADLANSLQAQRTLQEQYNQLTLNAKLLHEAAMYKTVYDYSEMSRIAVENAWRSIYAAVTGASVYGTPGGPDYGIYPGSSVGGNNLKPNTSAYNMADPSIYRSNGSESRLRSVPVNTAMSSSSSRSTVINATMTINGSRLSEKQLERQMNKWYVKLGRMAS